MTHIRAAFVFLLFIALAAFSAAQKTETLIFYGTFSSNSNGFRFSNKNGDTVFYSTAHPNVCMVGNESKSLYDNVLGADINPEFKRKKFRVTYTTVSPHFSDNDYGPGVMISVTKMVYMKQSTPIIEEEKQR